jgi:hypothetical protein
MPCFNLKTVCAFLLSFAACLPAFADPQVLDGAKIEAVTGLKGAADAAEKVFKVTQPRTDVKIVVDGNAFPPFMGLTSWAAFKSGGKAEAMVMGDLVLFEDEVNPVLSALLESGVEVTAIHNHFFFTSPQVYFMHIGGEGTVDQLAKGVRAALDKVKEIRGKAAEPAKGFGFQLIAATSSISAEVIEKTIGAKAQAKDGMAKVVIGRTVTMPCNCEVGAAMGVNTWAAFAGRDDHAIVCGDFAMTAEEVQPVLKAIRKAGINVVALHSHMSAEKPALYFMHYWGVGPAQILAAGFKSALDAQAAAAKPTAAK